MLLPRLVAFFSLSAHSLLLAQALSEVALLRSQFFFFAVAGADSSVTTGFVICTFSAAASTSLRTAVSVDISLVLLD